MVPPESRSAESPDHVAPCFLSPIIGWIRLRSTRLRSRHDREPSDEAAWGRPVEPRAAAFRDKSWVPNTPIPDRHRHAEGPVEEPVTDPVMAAKGPDGPW